MTRISAAENTIIEFENDYWRLLSSNGDQSQRVLVDAAIGHSLRYDEQFGSTRRLPKSGFLPIQHIQQVVIGWSNEDESWHLGLLLGPELAAARGSRWCELAYWPDPDTDVFADHATEAGEHLARTLNLPFYSVPVQITPPPPPPPLPELPLKVGMWSTHQTDRGIIELKRDKSWSRAVYGRILWYAFWMVIYIILSIATLTSDLALPNAGTLLPNPQILPYLGLATAGLLLGLIIYHFIRLWTYPDTILIDPIRHDISAWVGDRERWRVDSAQVQSVYASEVMKRREKKPITYHGELNVLLASGTFHFVLEQGEQADNTNARYPHWQRPDKEEVTPLTIENANTDLQIMALHIAKALGDIPCWYDYRIR